MKNKNKAAYLLIVFGLGIWLQETSYFGWNMHAESIAEMVFDQVSLMFVFIGMFLFWKQ